MAQISHEDPPLPPRRDRKPARPWRWRRIIIALVCIAVVVPALPVIAILRTGAAGIHGPAYGDIVARLQRNELLRPYATPADSNVDSLSAGQALYSLIHHSTDARPPLRSVPRTYFRLPYPDTLMFRSRGRATRGPRWPRRTAAELFRMADSGFTRDENDFLSLVDENPIWDDFRTVARTRRIDLVDAMLPPTLPDSVSVLSLQAMSHVVAMQELVTLQLARAAWHHTKKRDAIADRILRDVISFGFRVADHGIAISDATLSDMIIRNGADGLLQLYQRTDRAKATELAAVRGDPSTRTAMSVPRSSSREDLAAAIADSTIPRVVRFELADFAGYMTCSTFRELFGGPEPGLRRALSEARAESALWPGQARMFDLHARLALGPIPPPPQFRRPTEGVVSAALRGIARATSAVTGNKRIIYCASIVRLM